jgi:CBS-domain-containing membrane protein
MVLLYISTAWIGGLLTVAALWGVLGPGLALAVAPFGASALVAWAACLAGLRQGRRGESHGGPAPGWHHAR